jgi:tetratricopeptide (TPR) repeat protein
MEARDVAFAGLSRQRIAQPPRVSIDDLIARGHYMIALAQLLPRLEQGVADPEMLDRAAQCYWELGDADTAIELMRIAAEHAPGISVAWIKLARMQASMGQTNLAERSLDRALRAGDRSAALFALRHRLRPIRAGSHHARHLRTLASDADLPARDRALAMNTLGRIAHHAGRFRIAFRWFSGAKALHGPRHDGAAIDALVSEQIRGFDPSHIRRPPTPDSPRMVFVVGMPRSGTTLMAHILARHRSVHNLGESPALDAAVRALRQQTRSMAWGWVSKANADHIAAARTVFLSHVPPGCTETGNLLVTKMPLDCFQLGAAHLLWPEARFIYMSRHPLDVGLSNLMTLFDTGHGYARRLDWTAHMIGAVERSARDYADKLGERMRWQSYRALVEQPERNIRAVLSHAGLDWDPACLSPENGAGPVRTASFTQVRTALNRQGLGTWRNYADHLAPLIDGLGGPCAIRSWEAEDARFDPVSGVSIGSEEKSG